MENTDDPKVKRAKLAFKNRQKAKQEDFARRKKKIELNQKLEELNEENTAVQEAYTEVWHQNITLQNEKKAWIAEREKLNAEIQGQIEKEKKLRSNRNNKVDEMSTCKIIDYCEEIVSKLPNNCVIVVQPNQENGHHSVSSGRNKNLMSEARHSATRPSDDKPQPKSSVDFKFKGIFSLD